MLDSQKFSSVVKLSDNRVLDENGYLICTNAILGRTGTQKYLGKEISKAIKKYGLDSNQVFDVYRDEIDVFDESSLASLENKPLTLSHPREFVGVANHKSVAKGFVRDVYRDGNYIRGTIVVTDKDVIDYIVNDEMDELSLGYTCDYEYDDANEKLSQRNIRYNHISLVRKGRAGDARVIDELPKEITEKEKPRMSLFEKLFKVKANKVGEINGKEVFTIDEEEVIEDEVKTTVEEEETKTNDIATVVQDDETEKTDETPTQTTTTDDNATIEETIATEMGKELVTDEVVKPIDTKTEETEVKEIVKDANYFIEQKQVIDALPNGDEKKAKYEEWKKDYFAFKDLDYGDEALKTIDNLPDKGVIRMKTQMEKELETMDYYHNKLNPHKNPEYKTFIEAETKATTKDAYMSFMREEAKKEGK